MTATEPTYETEVFADDWGTYWVPRVHSGDEERSADEAVAIVAKLAGPFEDGIDCSPVDGRVEQTADGPKFYIEADGPFRCWQVEAS